MVNILFVEALTDNPSFKLQTSSIIAGGLAGLTVGLTYYPVDTLKTRLQAPQGFQKAGGFRGLYKGCLTLLGASIPTNSFFFGSYETSKCYLEPLFAPQYAPAVHLGSASFSRVLTCTFRVPLEVAIQRQQVYFGRKPISAFSVLLDAYRSEGVRHGLFRGLGSTMMRDLPYSLIELPLWELLKESVRQYNNQQITAFQSAGCGVTASAVAATITTPCDVVKTRIILTQHKPGMTYDKLRIRHALAAIFAESGVKGLFAGMTPRLVGVSGGRFLFFVVYEKTKMVYEQYMRPV